MKRVIISILSMCISAIFFIGCQKQTSSNDLLLKVLHNKETFIDEAGKSVYLKDYKLGEKRDIDTIPLKYTLIDFDSDDINEMVLYVSPDYGAYIVFHIYNETIYGFEFMERAMINLKTDGTFAQSQGAGINSYVNLHFEGETYEIIEKAYQNDENNEFRIDGVTASFEDVSNFTDKFEHKSNVIWTKVE